jgi:hypothetical protein
MNLAGPGLKRRELRGKLRKPKNGKVAHYTGGPEVLGLTIKSLSYSSDVLKGY